MKRKTNLVLLLSLFMTLFTLPVEAGNPGWKKDSKGWWYDNGDSTYPKEEFKKIGGKTYYFNAQGYMVTGWLRIGNADYYFKPSGEQASSEWIGNQWITYEGYRQTSAWVDNDRYYVDNEGNWDPDKISTVKAGWVKDSKGWKWLNAYGVYEHFGIKEISGKKYYFDTDGYMVTGWVDQTHHISDISTYYMDSNGVSHNDEWVDNHWLGHDGVMARAKWVDSGRYYVDSDGNWIPGYGQKGWKKDAKGWRYDESGYGNFITSNFKQINGQTYAFNGEGYMSTGWVYFVGSWFFFKPDGAMKKNAWEGDYWLDEDGFMAMNSWVDGGKYFVGPDGKWVPGKKHGGWEHDGKGWKYDETGNGSYATYFKTIGGKEYFFGEDGYMKTGWVYQPGNWFFFNSDGSMKKNAWEGDYWLQADGTMAYNSWVDGGKYYVGSDGKWVPGKK